MPVGSPGSWVQARTPAVRDATTATNLFLLDDAAKRVGTDAAHQWIADLTASTPEGGFCAALTQFCCDRNPGKT